MRDTQRWGLRVERVAGSADDTIAVGGRLSRATAPRLAEALEEAIAGGGRRIVLALGGLDYMNSAGLQVVGEISARLAALATIRLLKTEYVQNAATIGEHLMSGLRELSKKHEIIGDVRGRGMMIGVEFVRDRATKERAVEERNAVIQAMFRRGVLILGAGKNAVRFAPPLVLTREQADTVLRVFDDALGEVTSAHAGAASATQGTAS